MAYGLYVGQWKGDQHHGTGRMIWTDGRKYEGEFLDGIFAGQGRMQWHNGDGVTVYEGQYEKDLKHGHGKYTWPDGRVYDGEWDHGKRSGKALCIDANGGGRQGVWKDDKMVMWCGSGFEDATLS